VFSGSAKGRCGTSIGGCPCEGGSTVHGHAARYRSPRLPHGSVSLRGVHYHTKHERVAHRINNQRRRSCVPLSAPGGR
jgi:hypothetical protein